MTVISMHLAPILAKGTVAPWDSYIGMPSDLDPLLD